MTGIRWAFLFVSLCTLCPAAEADPRALVEAFFAPEGIADKRAVYGGELLQSYLDERTMGQYLGPGATKSYRLLASSDSSCTYAILVRYAGMTQDWYAFLGKTDGNWRLEAVRSLAQTDMLEALAAALRSKASRSAQEEWQMKNAELTLRGDAELKEFLREHRSQLDDLVGLAQNAAKEAVAAAARELWMISASVEPDRSVKVTIGGVLDNTVGFLYVPEGTKPPAASPHDVIYIEHVVDHWYLFKTT